jgi:signal transduction histidine kinase
MVLVWVAAVLLLGVEVLQLAVPSSSLVAAPLLAGAHCAAAAVALRRPTAGWWLSFLSTVATPLLLGPPREYGVPAWSPWTVALHLLVVFLLALAVPGRVTAFVVVLDAVVAAVAALPVGPGSVVAVAALTAVVVGLVGGLGTALRARRSATSGLDAARRDGATEQARRAAVEERTRIARELHDVVAHHLSAIAVRAESAPHRVPGVGGEAAAELQAVAVAARGALVDMRRLLGVLRAEDGERSDGPAPDLDAVADLVSTLSGSGAAVTFEVRGAARPVPAAVGLVGYRVAQEALSNAARHAPGAPCTVVLQWLPSAVRLQVGNGAGDAGAADRSSTEGGGHGLRGMRERAAAVGGLLVAGPCSDGGFLVDLTVVLA